MYNEMPGASQEWKTIGTERNGLVNLSREYGRPLPEPNRAVAWLKTTISFRQEADEEGGYWMDARTVGIRERETGVCRQKPV